MVRLATSEECAFYETRLYPLQDAVLRIAATFGPGIALTGGTALSRFVFQHRLSEDLDLFVSPPAVVRSTASDIAKTLMGEGLCVRVERESETFARFYVGEDDALLKVDVAIDGPRIDDPQRLPSGAYMHTLFEIATNKVGAFESREEWKDVVDLLYLRQRFTIEELLDGAERKRVTPAYDDLRFLKHRTFTGDVLLLRDIPEQHLTSLVHEMHADLAAYIKKKAWHLTTSEAIAGITADLLWDAPRERRIITQDNRRLLARRARALSAPRRLALYRALREERARASAT